MAQTRVSGREPCEGSSCLLSRTAPRKRPTRASSYNPRQLTASPQAHTQFLTRKFFPRVPWCWPSLTCLAAMVSSLELFFTISR